MLLSYLKSSDSLVHLILPIALWRKHAEGGANEENKGDR